MFAFILADFQVSGIPATMALAAVALIGYLVGRQSRMVVETKVPTENLERALADARQLEQLTENMLSATRDALDRCRQLKLHSQVRAPRTSSQALKADLV